MDIAKKALLLMFYEDFQLILYLLLKP